MLFSLIGITEFLILLFNDINLIGAPVRQQAFATLPDNYKESTTLQKTSRWGLTGGISIVLLLILFLSATIRLITAEAFTYSAVKSLARELTSTSGIGQFYQEQWNLDS